MLRARRDRRCARPERILTAVVYRAAPPFEVVPFDGAASDRHLVIAGPDRWLLSTEALALLRAAAPGGTAAEIAERLALVEGRAIDVGLVDTAVRANLVNVGLLSDASAPEPDQHRESPLIFRLPLIRATVVGWLADRFARVIPAMRPFWVSTVIGLAATATLFALTLASPGRMPFDHGRITWAAVLVAIASTFVHEFGHAAATAKAGARSGEIGFGVYWYFPVLYTELGDAWRLPRLERARIDAAGVWFQTVFVLGVCGVAALVPGGSAILAGLPTLLFVSVAGTCNPLLRFDGYWLATDLSGIPNLRAASVTALRHRLRGASSEAGAYGSAGIPVASERARTGLAVFAVLSAAYGIMLAVLGVLMLRRWWFAELPISAATFLTPAIGAMMLIGSARATIGFVRRMVM